MMTMDRLFMFANELILGFMMFYYMLRDRLIK